MRPIFLSSSLFSFYRLFFEKKTDIRAKSFVTKIIQKEEFNFLLFYSPFSLGILLFEDLIVFNIEIFVSSRKHVHRIGLSLSSMISELRPIYIYISSYNISRLSYLALHLSPNRGLSVLERQEALHLHENPTR